MSKNKDNIIEYCANCKFWYCYNEDDFEKYGESVEGECHRYPPNTFIIDSVTELGIIKLDTIKNTPLLNHPFTFASEWCGEFKAMKSPRWE